MHRADQISDEHLMVRYQDGDHRAFRALYLRHFDRLARFFERRGLEGGEWAQQAFARVVFSHRQYRPGSRFAPWLQSIARNLLRDARRRQRTMARANTLLNLPEREEVPAERVHARLVTAFALQAVAESMRTLLTSHHEEDLSFPELAVRTGVSSNTLKVRAHRAYAVMRNHCSAPAAREGGFDG